MLTDLEDILAALDPRLDFAEYAYCTVTSRRDIPWDNEGLIAVVREDEAFTLVLERSEANRCGFMTNDPFRRISLGVHSSLHAVGLTAAATQALAAHGISANVIAGFYHDHFLVPATRADEALNILQSLTASGTGDY